MSTFSPQSLVNQEGLSGVGKSFLIFLGIWLFETKDMENNVQDNGKGTRRERKSYEPASR